MEFFTVILQSYFVSTLLDLDTAGYCWQDCNIYVIILLEENVPEHKTLKD